MLTTELSTAAQDTKTPGTGFPPSSSPPSASRWKWFLALGLVLLLLGAAGVGLASFLDLASLLVFGPLLLASGIIQGFVAFIAVREKESLLHLAAGGVEGRVALRAFEDGSVEDACPPLHALLAIMAHDAFEGKDAHHPAVRRLFTRESLEASDWYQQRLAARQRVEERLWRRHAAALDALLAGNSTESGLTPAMRRREHVAAQLERVTTPAYLHSLHGTLGADPSLRSDR
jgi:hypothetical protein